MLSGFESVFVDTEAHFGRDAATPRELPAEIAYCERNLGAGTLCLRNRCVDIAWGYEIRLVHMRSPKIEIVTAFAFPHGGKRLPLYGMELVALGRRPVVGVLDLLDLEAGPHHPSIAEPILKDAHRRFPDLPYCLNQPDWFKQCRSGQDFFMRPEDFDTLLQLVAIHHQVMGRLAMLELGASTAHDADGHTAAIQQYKRHHRQHSPGLPLLHRVFGESWTNAYLDDYLFA